MLAALWLFFRLVWVMIRLYWLGRYVFWLGRVVLANLLGAWIALLPGFKSGTRGTFIRLALFVERYVLFWLFIWWLQWCFLQDRWADSATWLIGSRAEMQTALQVLPATAVAIFVLVAGSVFVVAQLAVTAYGQRAPLLIGLDQTIQGAIVRPLLLIVAALFLTGAVPDTGAPSNAATAGVTTVILATAFLIPSLVSLLFGTLGRYTAPVAFAEVALDGVDRELSDGETGLVVFRVPLIAEALKAALRRGDSIAVGQMLNALGALQAIYLSDLENHPGIRAHLLDDGSYREHWLAEDLSYWLVSAAQDALKLQSPESDTTAIAGRLGSCAEAFLEAGEHEDAGICARGLVQMAVSAHQVGVGINVYTTPVPVLARLEATAEAKRATDVAAYCLAGLALGIAYADFHLQQKHFPEWQLTIELLGPSPPWEQARQLVESQDWQQYWANKQYKGARPLLDKLRDAERHHRRVHA